MHNCHCAPVIWGMFHEKLPQNLRVALADKEFTSTTYNAVLDYADKVWEESGGSTSADPATVGTVTDSSQVAAVRGRGQAPFRGNPRGGRGGRGAQRGQNNRGNGGRGGNNRGGGNTNSTSPTPNPNNNTSGNNNSNQWVNTGPRHSDLPHLPVARSTGEKVLKRPFVTALWIVLGRTGLSLVKVQIKIRIEK